MQAARSAMRRALRDHRRVDHAALEEEGAGGAAGSGSACEQRLGPCRLGGGGREGGMDGGDLLRMDRASCSRSRARGAARLVGEVVGVGEVDVRHVPGLQAGGPGGVDEASARVEQAVPAESAPRSAARSAPPSISAPSRPPAAAIAAAFSMPRARLDQGERSHPTHAAGPGLEALQVGSALDLGHQQPVELDAAIRSAPAASRRPSRVRRPLMRSATPGPSASASARSRPASRARAGAPRALRAGWTASSRSMQTRSAPAAKALAKRSAFSPETNSMERGVRVERIMALHNVRTLCQAAPSPQTEVECPLHNHAAAALRPSVEYPARLNSPTRQPTRLRASARRRHGEQAAAAPCADAEAQPQSAANGQPRYLQIAAELKRGDRERPAIRSAPGCRPSSSCANTSHQPLHGPRGGACAGAAPGLITRRQRAGTVVIATPDEARYTHDARRCAICCSTRMDTELRLLYIGRVALDKERAREFGATPARSGSTPIGVRSRAAARGEARRRRRTDAAPDLRHPPVPQPGAATASRRACASARTAVYALIEREYKVAIERVEQDLQATLLDADDAANLGAEPGAPALRIVRRYYDADDRLLEVAENVHPGRPLHLPHAPAQVARALAPRVRRGHRAGRRVACKSPDDGGC